jgi:hypothetical protein
MHDPTLVVATLFPVGMGVVAEEEEDVEEEVEGEVEGELEVEEEEEDVPLFLTNFRPVQ